MKYPALTSRVNTRIRQEYLDYDYLDKLSEKELKWLNDFTEEENNATFNSGEKTFNKSKKAKKKIFDRNNARNRCQQSIARKDKKLLMTGSATLLKYKESTQEVHNPNELEEAMVEYLDAKKLQNQR
jgi:hypothetical protein